MTDFEYILSVLLIPIMYAVVYIAGKHDFLNTLALMFAEKCEEMAEKMSEQGDKENGGAGDA